VQNRETILQYYMSSEFESELLKISKLDLYRIHNTLLESLADCKYDVSHPFQNLSFENFEKELDEIKRKKLSAFLEYIKSKKISKSKVKNKKVKLDSIPEDGKKSKKSAKLKPSKFEKKYYDSDLPFFENCLTFVASRAAGDIEHLIVLFSLTSQIGKPALSALENYLKTFVFPISNIILISSSGLTSTAHSGTIPKLKEKFNIRVILHHQLLVNITKHILVKPHRRISMDEKKELMQKFGLTDSTISALPSIRLTDPVSLYYDFRQGEIIRIENIGAAESYRIVVDVVPT
jgi:DNA-directed RNA polymerase subunit H (RpoH/RPB5)